MLRVRLVLLPVVCLSVIWGDNWAVFGKWKER